MDLNVEEELCDKCLSVAPFEGAWIEIRLRAAGYMVISVAPFAGAWIEIYCVK